MRGERTAGGRTEVKKAGRMREVKKGKIINPISKGIPEELMITTTNKKQIETIPGIGPEINNTGRTNTHNTNKSTPHTTPRSLHNHMSNTLLFIQTRNSRFHQNKAITNTTRKINHR